MCPCDVIVDLNRDPTPALSPARGGELITSVGAKFLSKQTHIVMKRLP